MGNISFLRQWPTARLMMLTALMAVAMPRLWHRPSRAKPWSAH